MEWRDSCTGGLKSAAAVSYSFSTNLLDESSRTTSVRPVHTGTQRTNSVSESLMHIAMCGGDLILEWILESEFNKLRKVALMNKRVRVRFAV